MSELRTSDCEQRLATLPRDSVFGAFARGVVCSEAQGSFQLRIEHGGTMPRCVFRGRCVADASGSPIIGGFRWSRGAGVMAVVGIAMVTAMFMNDVLYGVTWRRATAVIIWVLTIALGMVVRIGGTHDEAQLLEFLRVELKAHEQQP